MGFHERIGKQPTIIQVVIWPFEKNENCDYVSEYSIWYFENHYDRP
jgi:hypothetical protein